MTQEQKIIRAKAGLLELAKQLGNVSQDQINQVLDAYESDAKNFTSFGQGNEGVELHVTVENKGKCTINGGTGVAYGFDPRGRSAAANKHQEHYVAFKIEKPIEPGKKDVVSAKMRYADDSTLALAQVDTTTCTDGTSWKRQ